MPDPIPNVADIIRLLPRPLQIRFNSIGKFVNAVVEEEETRVGSRVRLTLEQTSLIQLVAFIYSLKSFLTEGTNAAQAAVRTLNTLGIEGFVVGSASFERDNENTMRGKNLADAMMQNIGDTTLTQYITNAKTMHSLITTLRNELSRG